MNIEKWIDQKCGNWLSKTSHKVVKRKKKLMTAFTKPGSQQGYQDPNLLHTTGYKYVICLQIESILQVQKLIIQKKIISEWIIS